MDYKSCPLKKRPVFYQDEEKNLENNYQPQDLSVKRKAEDICENQNKKSCPLDLSTQYYGEENLKYMSPVNWTENYIERRSISPESITNESITSNSSTGSPIIEQKYYCTEPSLSPPVYEEYSRTWDRFHHTENSSSHGYNIQTSSYQYQIRDEPEDLSIRNYIPIPIIDLNSGISNVCTINNNPDNKKSHRFNCINCGKSYSTFAGLTKHLHFHCPKLEGNQVKKLFSCQNCEKTYTSLGALKMHIRTHTLPCKCDICGKAFSRPWLLQGHIRTHTGEKPFICDHCPRAFADRSNLRAHQQTHVDIKKYICGNCKKSFSRMSLLKKHYEDITGCSKLLHQEVYV